MNICTAGKKAAGKEVGWPKGIEVAKLARRERLCKTYVIDDGGLGGFVSQKASVECADAARADYLITGNQRHFPKFWKNTKVISSSEFLDVVAPHLLG